MNFFVFSVLAYVSISLFWRSFFIYLFLSFVLHVFPSVFLAFVLSVLQETTFSLSPPPKGHCRAHFFEGERGG